MMCGRKDPSIWHLLPLTGGQIRLLTVHGPTDDSALMKCSMEVVSLVDKPIFAALSYTWGGEPRDHQVTIDPNQVAVTQSCYDALRIFRDQWFDAQILTPAPEGLSPAIQDLRQRRIKRLWIDQLCVDQTNLAERASQILLMRRIYGDAAAVWAFIGPPPTFDTLQSFLRPIHEALVQLIIPDESAAAVLRDAVQASETVIDNVIRNGGRAPGELPEVLTQPCTWIHLIILLQRPYFTRRWIVQEVSINRNVYLYWDGALFDFEMVVRCGVMVNTHHYQTRALSQHTSKDAWLKLKDFLSTAPEVASGSLLLGTRALATGRFPQSAQTRFFRLLSLCGEMEQSEQQDAFYAMQSFAADDSRLPRVDYTKHATDICLEHALYFVQAGLGSAVLQFGILPSPDDGHKLPSWCPQWHRPNPETPRPFAHRPLLVGARMPKDLSSKTFSWSYQSHSTDSRTGTSHSLIVTTLLETKIDALLDRASSPRTIDESAQLGSRVRSFLAPTTTRLHDIIAQIPPEVLNLLKTISSKSMTEAVNAAERLISTYDVLPLLEFGLLALIAHATAATTTTTTITPSHEGQQTQPQPQHPQLGAAADHIWPALGYLVPGLLTASRAAQIAHTGRLARFQNGTIGTVDEGAQAGDTVALVPGCWLPIVLRPKKKQKQPKMTMTIKNSKGKDGKEGVYEMVGSAFILYLRGMKYLELAKDEEYPPLRLSEEDRERMGEVVIE
jgi:hypothetical protein